MIRAAFLLAACLAPFFFPLPLTLALALFAGLLFPLAPLATGLILDALYFAPGAYALPLYTVLGVIAALAVFLVRRFVKTSIMPA